MFSVLFIRIYLPHAIRNASYLENVRYLENYIIDQGEIRKCPRDANLGEIKGS